MRADAATALGDRRAAKQAQGAGADDVVLFAALANPTSNAIYRRIGFEAAGDSIRIDFAAA